MTIIDRLLDEAEKAQRKGHLLLAEVCRDAADELGLVIEERNQLAESHERAWVALDKAIDRLQEVEALRISLEAERNVERANAETLDAICQRTEAERDRLREALAVANSVCGKNNCNCPGAKKVRSAIEDAIPRMPVDRVGGW
jgi:phage-related minor tail protein